jgi:YVTN family beta-propeller protein
VGEKGFVSNLVSNSVSVVNLTTEEAIATIPVGNGPTPIAATGGKVFVGNTNFDFNTFTYAQGTVSVIDPATNEVHQNTINVGTNPQAMAVDAQGRLHVVCTGDYASVTGQVWVINPVTEQVVGNPVAIGGSPGSISIAANGTAYLISTSFTNPATRGLLAYNSTTLQVITSADNIIHIGDNPFGVLAAGGYVYVTDFNQDSLFRYDPASQAIVNLGVVGDGPQVLASP